MGQLLRKRIISVAVTGNLVRDNFGPGPKLSLKFLVRAD